jgi:SOS-response transcriptional repressor LexA
MSPGANPGGAIAAPFPDQCDRIPAQADGQKRHRGAEFGNQRAWRHGRRSRAAEMRRKTGAASRKAAAAILARLGLLGTYRCRPRAIRADQIPLLDGEAVAMLQRLDLLGG